MGTVETLAQYGLTPQTYEELLDKCQDKLDKIIDEDWSEILGEYGIKWNPDTLRKAVQPPIFGGAFVRRYYEENKQDAPSTIEEQIRNLEIAKTKYRDWHNAFNEQNRLDARVSQKLDYFGEVMKEVGANRFVGVGFPDLSCTSDKEMVIMLSDWHIGAEFYNANGCFNDDIAKERLASLLSRIFEIKKCHSVNRCKVVLLGDLINGNIHHRIKVTNRINVIDQIKEATELLTSFCERLCVWFEKVELHDVSGNHTRIDRKDDALHDERLDNLIAWSVQKFLSHKKNFEYVESAFSTDIDIIDICGKNYVAVHGDYDPFSKSGVSDLTLMIGFKPYAILFGHLHTCALDEVSGIKMIRSGCLPGTGDDHTFEKRFKSDPCQMVLICSENGLDCAYPVTLL